MCGHRPCMINNTAAKHRKNYALEEWGIDENMITIRTFNIYLEI